MKRTPVRRVSKKRAAANAEYAKRRKRFLEAHPFCQVWLKEHGIPETDAIHPENKLYDNPILSLDGSELFRPSEIPASTEIHHSKKPKATYLNDESTWFAVCRLMHDRIEDNKSWARQQGYLQNI